MIKQSQMNQNKLRLGTRRSLLAWAQSSWVAEELKAEHPGLEIELIGIETRGDRVLDVSLSKIEGKEFFVAELDDALHAGRVDFTVHSLKDLSLDRPDSFVTAAIPQRENPRDVILFGPHADEAWKSKRSLKIGTSSPRRMENLPSLLSRILPAPRPSVELVEIRGNVNTRLGRVHELLEGPKYLDGVVLAFAGLIRLWRDPKAREEMMPLFKNVRWMVLPLKDNPTAPGQGALAVECRRDDFITREILSSIHHAPTDAQVRSEREVLKIWGGGCHQRFGATCVPHSEVGDILMIRGMTSQNKKLDEQRWKLPPTPSKDSISTHWDGSRWRTQQEEENLPVSEVPAYDASRFPATFIAHSRAARPEDLPGLKKARIYTSGVGSWERLAQQGLWVEGCADTLGFDHFLATLKEPSLQLPTQEDWAILTHQNAAQSKVGWESYSNVIGTYRAPLQLNDEALTALSKARWIYWASGSQFDSADGHVSKDAHHACGPGKTADHLRRKGLNPQVFPDAESWRIWVKQENPFS